MNITQRPVFQKTPKIKKNPEHLDKVRAEYCVTCGAPPPNDAHHCRDMPPLGEQGLYTRLPGASLKSADEDAITLCRDCHDLFHRDRGQFRALNGFDFEYLSVTRAAVSGGEIDF
jgi:hypothetical protein